MDTVKASRHFTAWLWGLLEVAGSREVDAMMILVRDAQAVAMGDGGTAGAEWGHQGGRVNPILGLTANRGEGEGGVSGMAN